MPTTAIGQYRLVDRPSDAERGFVPDESDFTCGIVHIGALVLDLRGRADHAEPMGEAGRDITLFEVVRRQAHGHPPAERRRPAPDVDGDVEYLSFDDADQLSLRTTNLEVQATKRAGCRA